MPSRKASDHILSLLSEFIVQSQEMMRFLLHNDAMKKTKADSSTFHGSLIMFYVRNSMGHDSHSGTVCFLAFGTADLQFGAFKHALVDRIFDLHFC